MVRKKSNANVDWSKAVVPETSRVLEYFLEFSSAKQQETINSFFEDIVPYLGSFYGLVKTQKVFELSDGDVAAECDKAFQSLAKVVRFLGSFDRHDAHEKIKGSEFSYTPKVRNALSSAVRNEFTQMLNAEWLFKTLGFKINNVGESSRSGVVDENSKSNYDLVGRVVDDNPDLVLLTVVESVSNSLSNFSSNLRRQASGGGPHAREIEPNLLMNLAFLFSKLGRTPSARLQGDFHDFSEKIIELMGCDNSWVASHLDQAVKEWKKRSV